MIKTKIYTKPKNTSSSGGSITRVPRLQGIATEAEYASKAGRASEADKAKEAGSAQYAEQAGHAGTAGYATKAGEVDLSAEALDHFARKDQDETFEGNVGFKKNVNIEGAALFADVVEMLKKLKAQGGIETDYVRSANYDEDTQQGFGLSRTKNGGYRLSLSELEVWCKAIFHELEIRKLSYAGGNVYLSGAGSKLIKVVPVKKSVSADGVTSWVETTEEDVERFGWKCYLLADNGTTATMNYWQEGDQARCQTMGEIVSGGTYQNASNKSYWRTIPDGGVSTQNEKIYGTKTETYLDEDGNEQTRDVQVELYDGQAFAWIVIGKHCGDIDGYDDEFSSVGYDGSNPAPLETRDIPSAGDTIVLDGNRHRNEQGEYDKTDRQNVIILETTGEYAPRIACYANITEYKHTFTKSVNGSNKEVSLSVFETSPKGGTKINSSRFEWISDDGSTINIINYRGDWSGDNKYHKNDQVNHNNAVWVCVANSGVDVTEEPSDGATYWKKVLSGGKGDKGDDAVSYGIQFSERITTISSVETKVLGVRFIKSVGQQITSGSINDIDFNGSCVVYIDGVMNGTMSNRLNSGQTYLDIYHAFADEIKGKKGLSVELRNSDAIVVASNTFSFVESGEGVVMAYKNATSRPEPPVTEDLSLLTDGWSRTPQKGGSYLKVDNISYGSFDNGASSSVDSTSKSWTDVTEGGNSWKKSPSGLSDNYGWAIMKVSFTTNVDNSDVKVTIKAYSEGNYDFIQVHALDTEITGSSSLRKTGVAYISGNGIETSYSYHVTTAGQHFFYVSYCKDSSGNSNGDYGLFRLDLSENLVSMPSTVWMSQAVLKEGKAVLPWSTPVQITGDDAYRVVVSPSALIFDTDDNGRVTSFSGKTATIRVYQGDKDVSDQFSKYDRFPSNLYNCNGSLKDLNTYPLEIQVTEIETQVVTDTAGNESTISKTNGFLEFILTNGSANVTAHVDVQVNVAKFTGQMVNTNKRFSLQHQQLSNAVNDKVGSSELKQFKAEITQTAREISLSVSEKSVGRRNMLVGSACRKYGDGFMYMSGGYYDGYPLEQIEKNSGIDGVNCIHCRTKQTGTDYFLSGFRWNGNSPQGNIKLERGKNYVLSFYAKTNTPNDIYFNAEVLYQGSKIDTSRPAGYAGPTGYSTTFSASEADKWELFTVKVYVPSDAPYEYVEINIFAMARSYSFVDGYICKPMLEEGENYNVWTLSEQDYDYIGGNMLDNTLSLDKSGSLYDVNGTLTPAGFGESTSIHKSFTYKLKGTVDSFSQLPSSGNMYDDTYYVRNDGTCYAYNGSEFVDVGNDYYYNILEWRKGKPGAFTPFGLEANKDYVFSFMAKGTGLLTAYFYNPETDVFIESSLGATNISVDGNAHFQLTNKWERYWVHWRPSDSLHKYVLLRLNRSFQSDGSAPVTDCYIAQPKLEEGARVTEYTERKSDLIDRATAKAAGLEITSSGVTLYGEKIKVENTLSTGQTTTAALFKDGAINAALILAQMLTSQGHNGQMVRIADGLINIYGKAGTANIRFGLNSSGQAVLSYYDDNGNFLYDLGPAGIASLSKTDAKITSAQYIKAEDAGLTTPLGENVDLPWVDTTKSWYTATKDNNYILFVKGATGKTTTLYRYSAPRVNGKIVADSANGLSTYDLASAADGRTFTSRTMVKNGALANLANGVFLTGDATVYDNTKLVPVIKEGQFVTRPSFYVQIASFNARFTTLGIFEKIYSIQTETTFGNLDTGIMSNNNY